jgi:hypothetical protein
LSYQFFERFPNLLILLSENKSAGGLDELSNLAQSNKTQYILNFASIQINKVKGEARSRVHIQLFDLSSRKLLINEDYVGDWFNPGFEFTCQDKTIQCTINNALANALPDIIDVIESNSPATKSQKALAQERYAALMTLYSKVPIGIALVKQAIGQDSTEVAFSSRNIFQVLVSQDQSKFVAFSLEQVSAQGIKKLTENTKDKNVNIIITGNDIKDPNFLKETPQTYAFIILGVMHGGEWYIEKSNVTYFNARSLEEGRKDYFNSLQDWNFFATNSAVPSSEFWETGLFEKVRDLKQDPKWDKYGATIWRSDEANNRPYIGLYKVVANAIRARHAEENRIFEERIMTEILNPVYQRMKLDIPNSKIFKNSMIYGSDKKVVIHPVTLTNEGGTKSLRYYAVITNEVFEWVYFQSIAEPKEILSGTSVVDQMELLTNWNFSFDYLDDSTFWSKYVLAKDGAGYKYLRPLK